nr:uncharacterized protein LOC109165806 [Ipomoea trifida]
MESTTVFCGVETAFRCLSCAAKIHAASKLASCHARVWVCECEFSIHLVDGQITPNSILEDPLDYKNSSSCTNNDMSISGISHASETTNRKKKGGGFLPGIMLSLSNRRKGAPSRSPLS